MHYLVRRGFTLVEMLVVIAVMAVLMSLLLPGLKAARENARRVQCSVNAKQLMLSSILYSGDYKGTVPYGFYFDVGADAQYSFYGVVRREMYVNYGANRPTLWWCPDARPRNNPTMSALYFTEGWMTGSTTLAGTPSATQITVNGVTVEYGANRDQTGYGYFAGPGRGFTGTLADTYQMAVMKRFDDSKDAANRIVWGDPLQTPGSNNAGGGVWKQPANTHDKDGDCVPVGANFSFADGHAGWRQYRNGDNVAQFGNSGHYQFFMFKE